MDNILIDFYKTEATQKGFEQFFTKHAAWVLEDIQRYHERTGEDWWESKNAADFWIDHERVRRIVDDYFGENILKTYLFTWLQNLGRKLMPNLTIEPPVYYCESENINLKKHQLVRVFHDAIHQIALEPLYAQIYEELLKMLRAEKTGVKRCPSCHKLFEPTPRGHAQIFCAEKCKKRYYRAEKKKNN